MQCPIDGTTLVISDRSGVEIDYCPQCRGVWLDRGELDKILDRAAAPAPTGRDRGQDQGDYDRGQGDYDRGRGAPRKKREGFLGELFDF